MADPDVTVHALARASIAVGPWDWPLARRHRADIAAHFTAVRRTRPQIWNGRVLLSRDVAIEGDVLTGRAFETDFADFLWWRDSGVADAGLRNVFAMAAVRGSDGAFVLGAMASHTANAGRVYFPAGTPGPEDVREGRIDFDGSMARELAEETGLDAGAFTPAPGWTAVVEERRIALIRELRAEEPGAVLAGRVRAHIARDPAPELADVVLAGRHADLAPAMPPFVRAFLEAALAA